MEFIHHSVFEGFRFGCRVVEQPAPRTEPVVVLGGAYQTMHSNRRSERPWARAATLVNVELPGLGTADDLPADHGFDFMGDALGHLLDELALERVNIIAVSYGTAIAYRYAHRHADRVARLALVGATPSLPADAREALAASSELLRAGAMPEFARRAVDQLVCRRPECLAAHPHQAAEVLRRILEAADPHDAERYAAANDRLLRHPFNHPEGIRGVRALCVSGEHDRLCPPQRARAVAASIPGAVFTTMKGSGHVVHLERPKDFSDVLARFLTDEDLEGHPSLTPLERFAAPGRSPVGV
ncbi:alpha/beta fold hydrolase [Streptomyces sp. CRN 30]|uniref:alpha/beta fold hydrolase n=1 Tax=Streptomyces sp. CRN 30 TaxID=3075613 RepID=UPI002A809FBB|nr:alpha/beta fold hydrolase [Streptomyces sp. CRN 30]